MELDSKRFRRYVPPPPNETPRMSSAGVDDKLDALISRIRTLSDEPAKPEAAVATPPARPAGMPRVAAAPPPVAAASSAAAAGPTATRPPAPPLPASGSARPTTTPATDEPPTPTKGAPAPRRADLPPMPDGFKPSRDETWRPGEPVDARSSGFNESIVEAIVYRYLLNAGESEGRRVADQLQLPFRMVEPVLTRLKMEQHLAYKSATATNDYVYTLTETGRAIARNHIADCTYYGAAPVPLRQYIASIRAQTIEGQYPKKSDLQRAFRDLLINPKMLRKLGPAVASGRGMFLFGFPGNGKTSIAERVTGAFGKYIWIPRAVSIDGEIMRVFDPMCHELAMPEASGGLLDVGGFDKRWVRIERPTIIAGGELTMEMLEVQSNSESNISEAPLQLKSNCGTLVIDDFGRQKMRVDELLNRWIVPLEKRYDFLNMASGKKIQVPFDQLVVFSTNLEPKDLVDDAFLRRIPYKIEAENPPEEDFRKLFEIMCRVVKVPHDEAVITYLIETHYKPVDRPMRMCQPRDLLLQVKNYCLYNDIPIELKNEYVDFACENYFSVM